MKTRITMVVALLALLCLPMNSKAWFFDSMVNGMTSVANNMVDEGGEMGGDMLKLMGSLKNKSLFLLRNQQL